MAPTKNMLRKRQQYRKEKIMFQLCRKGNVDASYLSLHTCDRNFGIKFYHLTVEEIKRVVWGVRCGQQGYFIPPEVISLSPPFFYAILFRLWLLWKSGWMRRSFQRTGYHQLSSRGALSGRAARQRGSLSLITKSLQNWARKRWADIHMFSILLVDIY